MSKPRMTKAHFELIAQGIREAGSSRKVLIRWFQAMLPQTNAKFDKTRFNEACNKEVSTP